MALTNWLSKCKLTINSSEVPSEATDLPILLVYSNFPSSITDTVGGVDATGKDLRFATDIDGINEIPREVVNIDKALNILTVYVKMPSISSIVDTEIYCFWNNSSADEPGDGSASNKLEVWTDYYGAFHYQDVTTDWKGISDSTGKWSNQTAIGTPSTGTGHAEGTVCLNLSPTFGVSLHEVMTFNGGVTNDLMFWVNFNGSHSVGNLSLGFNGIPFGWLGAGQFGAGWGHFSTTTNAVPSSGWHHVWIRNVAGTATSYVDGVSKTQTTTTTAAEQFKTWGLGAATTPTWDCSEMRMTRGNNTSIANVQTMVANESDPTSFVTPGTPIVVSVSYTLTLTGLQTDTEVRIYSSSDDSELAGVEDSTNTFEWNFNHSGDFDVYIVIFNVAYEPVRIDDYTVTASDISLPIQQQFDRTYSNP